LPLPEDGPRPRLMRLLYAPGLSERLERIEAERVWHCCARWKKGWRYHAADVWASALAEGIVGGIVVDIVGRWYGHSLRY